jgi:hypothetical protein
VVESTGLENRQACKRLVGSNPTPSATFFSDGTAVDRTSNPPRILGNALVHCRWLQYLSPPLKRSQHVRGLFSLVGTVML